LSVLEKRPTRLIKMYSIGYLGIEMDVGGRRMPPKKEISIE
jgi:hypothetical protein